MDALLEDVPFDSIPERLGGGFKQYNEDFDFDLSPNGPFYYEGMEKDLLSLGINKSAKIKSNPVGSQKPVTTNVDSKLVLEPPATKSIPIATKKEAKTLNESETLGFSTFLQLSIKLYPLELLFCIMLLVIIGLASPPLGILATLLIALIYAIVKLI